MKIVYILDTYPSLSETFIAREIEALRAQGFEIVIFAVHAGEGAHPIPAPSRPLRWAKQWFAADEGVSYHRGLGAALWRDGDTRRLIEGAQHIHAGWASHPAFVAWGLAEAAGLPWSFSGHARDLFVEGVALDAKLGAARFAAVCTRAGQQFLQEIVPEFATRVLHVPHGLPLEAYPFGETQIKADAPINILSVGRLVEKKGFEVLLDAVALLHHGGHAVHAGIIGDGPLHARLESHIENNELQNVITLAGAIDGAGVLRAMREANCFVLPCVIARDGDRDGLPNVLLEAAAVGLPIITTNVGGIGEFVDDTTGRICPPHDAAAVAEAVLDVFRRPQETQTRCRAARRRVEEQFDATCNAAVLAQAFRQ